MFDLKREPKHPGDVLKYDFMNELNISQTHTNRYMVEDSILHVFLLSDCLHIGILAGSCGNVNYYLII